MSAEGTTTVEYYSTDAAGNTETVKSVTVRIDFTAPTTSAGLSPPANAAGWNKAPVTVTLAVTDALSGMSGAAARTEYSTDAGATWTAGTAATISSQGATTLQYRSTDASGNTEIAKSITVRIDSGKPTTTAYKASVKKGKKVKLGYKVTDASPGCGKAKVTLKIFRGRKLMKTLKLSGTTACNAKQSSSWKCSLKKGSYTLTAYATDIAGNAQGKVGSARLTVK